MPGVIFSQVLYMDMRTSYSEWLLDRILTECNKSLLLEVGEDSIPELQIKAGAGKDIRFALLNHYQKEVNIQRPFGGIRNPPMVLCNKIRHEFTNYDHIRDSLTDAVRSGGLDKCRELELRSIVTNKVKSLVDALINNIHYPLRAGGQEIDKRMLEEANARYTRKELGDIQAAIHTLKCQSVRNYAS
jgi:hypothetical protein